MVDKTLSEKLQPSLLDRLTDDAPGEKQEARDARVIDIRRLREIIQRDLAWLLNTGNLESAHDLKTFREVAASTVNYGLPDVTGKVSNAQRAVEIRQAIRRAIEVFEPRILPGTLSVEVHQEKVGQGAVISFDIHGDVWAQPLPLELYLRTALDVTTGEVTVSRQG
ncbi:type VI secretion system baseplate subunit TssE [Limibaculum sp. FT325]|uniref:type VI secretion system baseplate subunit TssE n=1 Tax=Thermohalobaculum sediminis TaxID=2939436 RepID=UPI0020C08807|nr:type VI secretion system baseplate subunit TssE [Limibaculum sediminis]MCL5777301.1 type VI secretion system baseplate subunit TssE [Limibaculum sediminis]